MVNKELKYLFGVQITTRGELICNDNVQINLKKSYLFALQLHSRKDLLLGYTTAKSQFSNSFPTLQKPLLR